MLLASRPNILVVMIKRPLRSKKFNVYTLDHESNEFTVYTFFNMKSWQLVFKLWRRKIIREDKELKTFRLLRKSLYFE